MGMRGRRVIRATSRTGARKQWDVSQAERMAQRAQAFLNQVKYNVGEIMPCPQCGKQTPIRRLGGAWDVECLCGWSAAGSGPPAKSN